MKKIILAVFLSLCGFSFLQAQEIPERKHDAFKPMEARQGKHHRPDMSALNLSDAQKLQFKAVREDHQQKMAALKKMDNITVKEYRERMQSLQKEHKEKMQSLFTPEQKEQMKKGREEQKANMQNMMKHRAEKMKTELNLTDDQSARMEQNRKNMGEKMKALRENKTMSEEDRRIKMQELMKEQKANMRSVLTEEQLKKMKEMKKAHPHEKKDGPDKSPAI